MTKHEFQMIADQLVETLVRKNAAYGDSFQRSIDRYGLIAALTRISDKFHRLESLVIDQVDGESLEDTLLDMAGYCILTLAIHQKTSKDPNFTIVG